jgi:hypothetical protein
MTAITRSPENTNLLQSTKFILTFDRIRTTQYFCQSVNLPGVSLGEVNRATPFLDMYSPGTKLTYDPLTVEFILDEELQGWKNLYDWFLTMADPDGFEQRDGSRELQTNKHFSDATLTILSGLNNPLIRIHYTNIFPLSISDIRFDSTQSADTILTATATFRYQSYKYLTV